MANFARSKGSVADGPFLESWHVQAKRGSRRKTSGDAGRKERAIEGAVVVGIGRPERNKRMTNTTNPVRRETLSAITGRPIIVELRGTFLMMRLKHGRKDSDVRVITYDELWNVARPASDKSELKPEPQL